MEKQTTQKLAMRFVLAYAIFHTIAPFMLSEGASWLKQLAASLIFAFAVTLFPYWMGQIFCKKG